MGSRPTGFTFTAATSVAVAVLTLALFAAGRTAASEPEPTSIRLRDGVIVDPERSAVYLMAENGGVEALALADGAELWSSAKAARPLLVAGSYLIAQVEPAARMPGAPVREPEPLVIAAIDLEAPDGDPRRFEIPLPHGVRPHIGPRLESRFELEVERIGTGVRVAWNWTFTGPPPARPGELPAARERREGSADIDLESMKMAAAPPFAFPGQWTRTHPMAVAPVWTGNAYAATSVDDGKLLLSVWAANASEPSTSVVVSERVPLVHLPSVDLRHLLISERIPEPEDDWTRYAWTVVALDTGERVAGTRFFTSAAPFVVAGGRLIHEVPPHSRGGAQAALGPPSIRAVDLATGRALWNKPTGPPSIVRTPPPAVP